MYNIFTGFNSNAVGSNVSFTAYIKFQNYALNQAHIYYITLEDDATGKKLIDNIDRKSSFSMLTKQAIHTHEAKLRVIFPKEGVYRLRVYVDDKEEESLYMRIGD